MAQSIMINSGSSRMIKIIFSSFTRLHPPLRPITGPLICKVLLVPIVHARVDDFISIGRVGIGVCDNVYDCIGCFGMLLRLISRCVNSHDDAS